MTHAHTYKVGDLLVSTKLPDTTEILVVKEVTPLGATLADIKSGETSWQSFRFLEWHFRPLKDRSHVGARVH